MEAVVMHGSYDQTMSPYKSHIGNPSRIIHHRPLIISRPPSENLFPPHDLIHHAMGGLLQPPPPPFLSHSYPPYSQLHQPPLLPLPAAAPRLSTTARGLSCPPAANKLKKANNNGNSPKKSKSPTKKEEKKSSPKKYGTVNILVSDPKELPKDVGKVLPLPTGKLYSNGVNSDSLDQKLDVFSGTAAFAISPPPSSLPLPTFSLRPKLVSCKAEAAAGIDTGATDNLRRLLRLR